MTDEPADPLDALLRRAMRGDAPIEELRQQLRDAPLDLAMNGDGRPLVVGSCVVVATSDGQRSRTFAPQWQRVDLAGLAGLLPDDADVSINPGGPAPVRLAGGFIRYAV